MKRKIPILVPALLLGLMPLAANAQTPAFAPDAAPLPGVDRVFALEGNNTLLAYATPEGYAGLRSLVRHLDGDLDILQTDVVLAEVSPSTLKTLGVGATDDAALVAAFHNGKLPPADHVRLTTREDTPIDTLLHAPGGITLPLSLVPREGDAGTLTLEMIQPASVSMSAASGGTALVRLPGGPDGTLRLLFLSPTLRASDARPAR